MEEWVLRQRAAGLSAKTIRERIAVVGRLPDPVLLTPIDVDRFLANPAWAKATRATYHGAIRAWCLWLVRTGRRPDDPTLIATTPKVPKGRPRPVADELSPAGTGDELRGLRCRVEPRRAGPGRGRLVLGVGVGVAWTEARCSG